MGWKAVRNHYHINHIVHIWGDRLCIGSAYISDLIQITPQFEIIISPIVHEGTEMNDYVVKIRSDFAKFKELLETPDVFDRSLPVYTYYDGQIVEKKCEEYGWPNVTHDGELMYSNNFFSDKMQAVRKAKQSAINSIEMLTDLVASARKTLCEHEDRLAKRLSDQRQLDIDYPEIFLDIEESAADQAP